MRKYAHQLHSFHFDTHCAVRSRLAPLQKMPNVSSSLATEVLRGTQESSPFLYEQAKSCGLNIIGTQEGRNEECLTTSHGIYRICAGHADRQYGVELCVNLHQPLGHDSSGRPLFLRPHCLQVAHKDPQRLIVRCDSELLSGWFFVAHGPHSGRPQSEREPWWHDTEELLQTLHDGSPWFWLIDANAAPDPADGCTIFADHRGSSANTVANTLLFRGCLAAYDLCAPSTSHLHQGSRHRWTSLSQTTAHCTDYVLVPRDWLPYCALSCVIDSFEPGNSREDRRAVGLHPAWHAQTAKADKPRRTPRLIETAPPQAQAAKQKTLCSKLESLNNQTPAFGILRCLRDFLGPTVLKHCKKKTIPQVRDRTDQTCRLPAESLATWIDFFRDMEGGKRMPGKRFESTGMLVFFLDKNINFKHLPVNFPH
eukprot:s2501_g17.t1